MRTFAIWGAGDVYRSGLREIVAVRAALDALESALVAHARARGTSWHALGEDLGLTAHGARRRHLGVDPRYAALLRRRSEDPLRR